MNAIAKVVKLKQITTMMADIRIELKDEFDQNFDRQAFFTEAWQRRKSPLRPGGALLVDTGRMRRSVRAQVKGMSVIFTSDHPAAAIHNDGGEIVVTARMKRFFWAKYIEATGGIAKRKNGEARITKKNRQISAEAEFWKLMALMKVGKKIRMPRRRFIGEHPQVEKCCTEIVTKALNEYFETLNLRSQ